MKVLQCPCGEELTAPDELLDVAGRHREHPERLQYLALGDCLEVMSWSRMMIQPNAPPHSA